MCTESHCKNEKFSIMRMSTFVEVASKLERCEQCCYRQEKSNTKNATYDLVRKRFVQLYWNSPESARVY